MCLNADMLPSFLWRRQQQHTHTPNPASGQHIIFYQPRFPWKKGISLPKRYLLGPRSCEVANFFTQQQSTCFLRILFFYRSKCTGTAKHDVQRYTGHRIWFQNPTQQTVLRIWHFCEIMMTCLVFWGKEGWLWPFLLKPLTQKLYKWPEGDTKLVTYFNSEMFRFWFAKFWDMFFPDFNEVTTHTDTAEHTQSILRTFKIATFSRVQWCIFNMMRLTIPTIFQEMMQAQISQQGAAKKLRFFFLTLRDTHLLGWTKFLQGWMPNYFSCTMATMILQSLHIQNSCSKINLPRVHHQHLRSSKCLQPCTDSKW